MKGPSASIVIILAVIGNFCGVDPNVFTLIKVSIVHTGINYSYNNTGTTTGSFTVLSPTVRDVRKAKIYLITIYS